MILTIHSQNSKVGAAAATYLPLTTCPSSCPLRYSGCYALCGVNLKRITHTIALATKDMSVTEIVELEAKEIEEVVKLNRVPPRQPMRLHVSGDVQHHMQAKRLSRAALTWRSANGGPVWTYTHSWREVPRAAWGHHISALASVDTAEQANEAWDQGYAPSLVVDHFRANSWDQAGIHWRACPAQLLQTTCSRCHLCWDVFKLREKGHGIAFQAHGPGATAVVNRARELSGDQYTLWPKETLR